jgi:uncharacterized lipoprotein YmbA
MTLVLATALTGCLSRPTLAKRSFALQSPLITGPAVDGGVGTLAARLVAVAPPFDGKALVYRTGENEYERDPYAELVVAPDRALAMPIRARLRNAGVFANVIEPGSALTPDRTLEGYVTEFYGDFRKPEAPAAVLSLRFVLLRREGDRSASVILQKDYSRRVPLSDRTATALVAGWDRALDEILTELVSDLKAVR